MAFQRAPQLDHACSIIPMSTGFWPPAVLAPDPPAGSHRAGPSSFRSKCSPCLIPRQVCRRTQTAFHAGALQFHGHLLPLAEPRAFASWLRVFSVTTGSSTPNGLSAGQNMCCAISAAYTHRVAISNSRLVASLRGNVTFAGATPLTATRNGSYPAGRRVPSPLPPHLLPRGFMRIRTSLLAKPAANDSFRLFAVAPAIRSDQAQEPPRPRCPFTRCGMSSCGGTMQVSNASPPRNSSSDLRLISAVRP